MNVTDVGRAPRKQGLFAFCFNFLSMLWKTRKLFGSSGEGHVANTQMPTAPLRARRRWISSNRALHAFNWKLQRSDFEWINARINSECSSFPRNARLSLSVQWPFIKWNLITAFRPYQQQERQEINCLENIIQLRPTENNLIVLWSLYGFALVDTRPANTC